METQLETRTQAGNKRFNEDTQPQGPAVGRPLSATLSATGQTMDLLTALEQFSPIESTRIILRRLELSDFADYARFATNGNVTKWLNWPPVNNISDVIEMVKKHVESYSSGEVRDWAIVDKDSASVVGLCGFLPGSNLLEPEIGFLVSQEFWGKGYATDAISMSVEFEFNHSNINKVIAESWITNERCHKVLTKNGFLLGPMVDERIQRFYLCRTEKNSDNMRLHEDT